MKAVEQWRPTKYAFEAKRLVPSSDKAYVGAGSWLMAKIVADTYSRLLPQYASGRMLDLGCGYVPLYMAYRDCVSSVTCVDWENTKHANPHLDIITDLCTRLPLADESFDTVLVSDVLEHLSNPEAFLSELRRVLAPGGVVLVNVPFMYWVHEEPFDFFRYTEYGLRELFVRAELTVDFIEAVGGGGMVVADVLGKYLAHVPVVGPTCAKVTQRAIYYLSTSLRNSRGARKMPLAYFAVLRRQA